MVIAIAICLLVSFFLSGSETALTAANKMKVQTRAANDDKKAKKLLILLSKPEEFITAILIGNNVANILLPTLVTIVAIEYGFNVGVATAILTGTIIIFAEVLPKSVAATFSDRLAYLVLPVIRLLILILKPVTVLLNSFTGAVIRFLSKKEESPASISKEELQAMVEIAHTEGTVENDESYRIKGVLDFHNLNVRDVLKTPRVEVKGIPVEASYEEARDIILKHRFTRYPVFDGDLDTIIGVLHAKMLISWSVNQEKRMEDFADMDPLLVTEAHSIQGLFRKMLNERKHLAVVLDEYGGTEGIITHEDIIEAMIGQEIEDENDLGNEVLIEKVAKNRIISQGKVTLRRLNFILNTNIPEEEDILTGFLASQLGRLPAEGDTHKYENLYFTVLEVDEMKVKRVEITKLAKEET